jgi:asparagine synthase (glutamine-hydrolysing)
VKRLPPGCNLFVSPHGEVSLRRYWDYPDGTNGAITFDEASETFRALFLDAVKLRMRSDVPLGLTLSSGIDSSSIAYAMRSHSGHGHAAYTARFRPEDRLTQSGTIYRNGGVAIDESIVARQVCAETGMTSHVLDTDYADFVARLSRIIYFLESGNSSPATIPLMQLFEVATKELTVVLEGQGADELLAGYTVNLLWPSVIDDLKKLRFGNAVRSIREYSRTYTLSFAILMALRALSNRFPIISRLNDRRLGIEAAIGPALRNFRRMADHPQFVDRARTSHVETALVRQHAGGLVNLLHYGDAVSMAHGLESRLPFMDYRLVEFVWTLPTSFKFDRGVGKHVLRHALRDLVPTEILENRTKHGFSSPIGEQFRKPSTPDDAISILLSDRCMARGLFDRGGLERLIAAHRSGRHDHGTLLFRMLSAELWFRVHIDR